MFRLEFDYAYEDVLRFNEYHFRYSPTMCKNRLFRYWFIPFLVLAGFWCWGSLSENTMLPTHLITGSLAALATAIILRVTVRRQISDSLKRLFPENKGLFLGERIAEIQDDHIWLKTPGTESKFSFDSTSFSVVEDSPRVYVYIAPSVAIVINRNSVKAGDPDLFLLELQARIDARADQRAAGV